MLIYFNMGQLSGDSLFVNLEETCTRFYMKVSTRNVTTHWQLLKSSSLRIGNQYFRLAEGCPKTITKELSKVSLNIV